MTPEGNLEIRLAIVEARVEAIARRVGQLESAQSQPARERLDQLESKLIEQIEIFHKAQSQSKGDIEDRLRILEIKHNSLHLLSKWFRVDIASIANLLGILFAILVIIYLLGTP